jgi:hypothetical protein
MLMLLLAISKYSWPLSMQAASMVIPEHTIMHSSRYVPTASTAASCDSSSKCLLGAEQTLHHRNAPSAAHALLKTAV